MKPEEKSKICFVLIPLICIIFISTISILKSNGQDTDMPSGNAIQSVPHIETELDKARAKNSDTVAWLTVPSTEINNAVMQFTDNDYYLRRNEEKEESIWGCYFADYYVELTDPSSLIQNTVIYGHTANNDDPNGKKFS